MSPFGADWSGLKQLRIDGTKEGEEFSLSLPAPEERYDVDLYYGKGPDYGDAGDHGEWTEGRDPPGV